MNNEPKSKPFEIVANGVSIYSTNNLMQAASVYSRELKKGNVVVLLHNGAVKYSYAGRVTAVQS